jgi:predicted anti-sigma-YlaC factor YlaD
VTDDPMPGMHLHIPDDDLPCQVFVELVTAYLDRALDPVLTARIEEHLEICGGCRNHLEQLRTTVDLLGALCEDDVDGLAPAARQELMAAFRAATA